MTSLLARGTRRNTSSPDTGPDRWRALLAVALRPTGVVIVLICVVVLVTLVSSNSDLTGAVGAIAASWLALHHVSLTVTGAPLGVLPLLPTAVLVWAVARGCARAVTPATDLREAGRVVAAAVAGPVAATLIAFAVIADASTTIPLASPSALPALAAVIGIHLVAACAGVATVVGRSECARLGVPDWVPALVRPAARAAGLLFAAGAAAVAASLLWSWSEVGALLGGDFGFVGVLGSTVLSVLYLPNVAVGAVAVLAGGPAHAGGTSVSLFDIVAGPVPPVPVLGGVPTELVGTAWPILLVVPVTIGALLGRDCGRLHLPAPETAYTVAGAAAGVGVLTALVGFLAGGDLGSYGFVGVEPGVLGLITFGWLVVPGLLVGVLVARRGGAPAESDDPVAAPIPGAEESGLEIKRLERPTVRYRAAAAEPESEPAPASASGPGSEPNSDPTSPEAADDAEAAIVEQAAIVAEAEIVEEPATPTVVEVPSGAEAADPVDPVDADVDPAPEAAAPVEGDLPDGPVTPRD